MKIAKIHAKKGGITNILVDFWMYIVFVLVVIVFYLIFSVSKDVTDKQITGIDSSINSYTDLINYLKTPVVVDGTETNIAGLIRLWQNEPDRDKDNYKDILEKISINILNGFEYD